MSEAKEVAEKLIEWSNFSSIYMAGAKVAAEKLIEWSKSPKKQYLRG
jgi:hypothetical protein